MAVYVDVAARYVRTEPVLSRLKLHIAAGLVLIGALAFRVWVKIVTVDLGYRLATLKSQAVELDMQRRELEFQLSVLTRPDRLAGIGREKLHMQNPQPGQVIRIEG